MILDFSKIDIYGWRMSLAIGLNPSLAEVELGPGLGLGYPPQEEYKKSYGIMIVFPAPNNVHLCTWMIGANIGVMG